MALKRLLGGEAAIAVIGLLVVGGGVVSAFAVGILGALSVGRIDNTFSEGNQSTTDIQTGAVVDAVVAVTESFSTAR
jgi:hypothetical protein